MTIPPPSPPRIAYPPWVYGFCCTCGVDGSGLTKDEAKGLSVAAALEYEMVNARRLLPMSFLDRQPIMTNETASTLDVLTNFINRVPGVILCARSVLFMVGITAALLAEDVPKSHLGGVRTRTH